MGFALGAGVKFNAPMIGPGDYFQVEVDYTEGASRYANNTAGYLELRHLQRQQRRLWHSIPTRSLAPPRWRTDLELTTAWAVNAAYTHNWNAAWKSTLWGSYMAQSYNTAANNMLCTGVCDHGGPWVRHELVDLGRRSAYPVGGVSTFQIGLEVIYSHLQSASPDQAASSKAAPTATKPAGDYSTERPEHLGGALPRQPRLLSLIV